MNLLLLSSSSKSVVPASFGNPQKSVDDVVPIEKVPGNLAAIVHAAGESEGRSLRIDRGNCAVRTAQILVVSKIRIDVNPGNRTPVVDRYRTIGKTPGAFKAVGARPRRVERRDFARALRTNP